VPTPKIDIAKFSDYASRKLITGQKHPMGELIIWNYTPIAQFSRTWDEVTLTSRGLITDTEGNIKARPFRKFFNYEEHTDPLPNESFVVHEKFDGSLGILYEQPNGTLAIATRGSFTSDQAIVGTKILEQHIKEFGTDWIKPGYTYLFEIIYPENRIVVNYGQAQRLVLLAVINTKDGSELAIEDINYPDKANMWYNASNLEELRGTSRENSEGYVIHFEGGLRLKMKHAEYVRLHRLLTQVSSKSIWELLKNGQDFTELIENVPDEFYDWVKDTANKLTNGHDVAMESGRFIAKKIKDLPTRKDQAAKIANDPPVLKAIVFALLDGKDSQAEEIAWKSVKPKYEQPFKEDIDS
jgi:RNA ligase